MVSTDVFMAFPQPQYDATFLDRKQRFLALMEFTDGSRELVYCANSGSMVGALTSGARALIWDSGKTTRENGNAKVSHGSGVIISLRAT